MKELLKTSCTLALVFFVMGAYTIVHAIDAKSFQHNACLEFSSTNIQNNTDLPCVPCQQENPEFQPSSKIKINPIGKTTQDMFFINPSSTVPIPEIKNQLPPSEKAFAHVIDSFNTFQIILIWQNNTASFTLAFKDFSDNSTTQLYSYTLPAPYEFTFNDTHIGTLTSLEIIIRLSLPYQVYYTYQMDLTPQHTSDFVHCRVKCSPISINEDHYSGRILTTEEVYENPLDFDQIVIKRSNNYTGDLNDSMVEFRTPLGVFQRGWQYLSCDTDGCSINVFFQYPVPPDYFEIEGGTINRFWIDSGWEATVGDHYSSSQSFTVNPLNHPPLPPMAPTGLVLGVAGKLYSYQTNTIDPEGQQVSYLFNWGDGTPSRWLKWHNSGETVSALHHWLSPGIYQVCVKSKDIYEVESNWSMPLVVHIVLLGDMNDDGHVDNFDINPFILAITNPATYEEQFGLDPSVVGDCNQDGQFDNFDINVFVFLLLGG